MVEGIDFIYKKRKSGKRFKCYKDNCTLCGKDKGFIRKDRLNKACHKCNSDLQANVGRTHNGKRDEVISRNREMRRKQIISITETTKQKISISNKKTWIIKNGQPRTREADLIRKAFSKLLSRYLKKRYVRVRTCKTKFELVGFTPEQLFKHIESQFQEGMNWDNYGEWHLDHKMPDSWFKYNSTDDQAFKDSWSLQNLQPMWAKDNLRKGNKYVNL